MSTTHSIRAIRRNYWWEKFFWFVSSENYIVVGGRDAQQNEQLVRTHLSPGDVYVHADVEGASCVVIKNPHATRPVPPLTLAQAGSMVICRSAAWESGMVTSAWWAHAHQVSKSGAGGVYLPVGTFAP